MLRGKPEDRILVTSPKHYLRCVLIEEFEGMEHDYFKDTANTEYADFNLNNACNVLTMIVYRKGKKEPDRYEFGIDTSNKEAPIDIPIMMLDRIGLSMEGAAVLCKIISGYKDKGVNLSMKNRKGRVLPVLRFYKGNRVR